MNDGDVNEMGLTPEEVAEGEYFDRPWWVIGGWSIDAFTGAARGHEDIDARLDRPQDRLDLDRTWHLLADGQGAWLRDAVRRMDPEHAWLPLLA